MPTARWSLDVNIESEPPFLEQDALKLNRNIVRKNFSSLHHLLGALVIFWSVL